MENRSLALRKHCTKVLERSVTKIHEEVKVTAMTLLRRVHQLKNFRDSGAMATNEVALLDTVEQNLKIRIAEPLNLRIAGQPLTDEYLGNLRTRKASLENYKSNCATLTVTLDKIEKSLHERFLKRIQQLKNCMAADERKFLETLEKKFFNLEELNTAEASLDEYEKLVMMCNVPERRNETSELYVARLKGFMDKTWRKPAELSREKKQKSLIDWVQMMDQTNKQNKATFDILKTALVELGTQVSLILIEYFMLVMAEDISATLDEVENILRCLSVGKNSFVIKRFLAVVGVVKERIRPSRQVPDDAEGKAKKEESSKEMMNIWLEKESEYSLLRLITVQVLRLEVIFCYRDKSDVNLAMVDDFNFKLDMVRAKINELKEEVKSMEYDGSLVMKGLFYKDLEVGIKEVWNNLDWKPEDVE